MSHRCHAIGCEREVPPAMFACRTHWYTLPKWMRDAILREYRPGQEIDKNPSARYVAVASRAVAMMAFKPHDEEAARATAPYILRSEEYRRLAIEHGDGDPLAFLAAT